MARRRAVPSRADVELAAAAKAAAGGPANLARLFGASKQAVSEWGRVRPIPRHLRPRLEDFIRRHASAGKATVREGDEDVPWRSLGWLIAGTELKLMPPSNKRQASTATNAWQGMNDDRRNVLRNYVRSAAFIATAAKQLLSNDAAGKLIATLSAEVSAHVNTELLRLAP
jgi:hypothetical protein